MKNNKNINFLPVFYLEYLYLYYIILFKNLIFITKLFLFQGGFEESTILSNKEYRVWIKNRKGFIKYALQYGYCIHPVFVFNESIIYNKHCKLINYSKFNQSYKKLKDIGLQINT